MLNITAGLKIEKEPETNARLLLSLLNPGGAIAKICQVSDRLIPSIHDSDTGHSYGVWLVSSNCSHISSMSPLRI